MKKIKKYIRIEFELTSPLAIGSGENNMTDQDIVRDSSGQPYIPGSSLAGVYRCLFSHDTAETYFGPELTRERIEASAKDGKNRLTDSSIIVYDAHIKSGQKKSVVTKRDMAALDEYKTAVPGAKFDFEILEPGVRFVTYIEQNMEEPWEQCVINEIADAWMKGKITVGAKTARGYGCTKGIDKTSVMYDLADPVQRDKWLEFDLYGAEWDSDGTDTRCVETTISDQGLSDKRYVGMLAMKNVCTIILELRQLGGISIRQYTTDVGEEDYRQLTACALPHEMSEDPEKGTPVIPGTSWAGAFRAQMGKLDFRFKKGNDLAEKFFGKEKQNKSSQTKLNQKLNQTKDQPGENSRSRIKFSESRITGGCWASYTRNAIDRFTGGTVDGALYSEETYYNGRTNLVIRCDFGARGSNIVSAEERERFAEVMAAAIVDLDGGFMAVGGLTAVGRGLFQVDKICVDGYPVLDREAGSGEAVNAAQVYYKLARAAAGKEVS